MFFIYQEINYMYNTFYKLTHILSNRYVDYSYLVQNPNPKAIEIIYNDIDKLNEYQWYYLCLSNHDELYNIIVKNPSHPYINWRNLCKTSNPNIIKLLKQYDNKIHQVFWRHICSNPYAVELILDKKYKHNIYWKQLCANTNDIILELVSNNLDKLNHDCLLSLCQNTNPKAIEIIIKIMNNIKYVNKLKITYTCWIYLWSNPSAYKLILSNLDKLRNEWSYEFLCKNINTDVLKFIEKNIDKLNNFYCWNNLCQNTNSYAIKIISNNIDKIYDNSWCKLCLNTNTDALELVSKHLDKLNASSWSNLCANPNPQAFELVKNNLSKLDVWCLRTLWCNPNIWTYDYDTMKKSKMKLHNELRYYFMNPQKILKIERFWILKP